MNIGIIRETKDPPDKRVPLTPEQCRRLKEIYTDLNIFVQPSDYRCFTDDEYKAEGILLHEDLSACETLMGVKEVKIDHLVGEKTYFFFSHTAKEQPYNRKLLQGIINKNIRLVDYEYLTRQDHSRVVAFGRWAGVVGAYNGLRAYGLRYGSYNLKPASDCRDLEELQQQLGKVVMAETRIAVTGGGRVAGGAIEILEAAGIAGVDIASYLNQPVKKSVYCRLDPWHYTRRSDGSEFEFEHFVSHPEAYDNAFKPYARRTDLFIACHFWDPESPVLLSHEDLTDPEIPIRVIADISCDIDGPIPSTIRASTIAKPFYGYDPGKREETAPFSEGSITVMAVDNLPGELPRDASTDFGEALIEHVIPELLGKTDSGMMGRASIASDGHLTETYAYLKGYLEGKD